MFVCDCPCVNYIIIIMITNESFILILFLFSMADLVLRAGSRQGPRRVLSAVPGRTRTPMVLIALFWDEREGVRGWLGRREREGGEKSDLLRGIDSHII